MRGRWMYARRLVAGCLGLAMAASCRDPTEVKVVVTTDFDCSMLRHVTVTVGPVGSPGVAGQSNDAQQQRPSNQRFRSFAERYIIERCRDWPQREVDERTWAAILEAKSIYNKVKEVGRTLGDDT